MKLYPKYWHILLYLIVLANSLYAQQSDSHFRHLTTVDGLPQNMVDCMLQDDEGFLWFGTWNGLCRYDGYTFELFDGQNGQNSLRTNFIQALSQDAFGNIWIGTKQGLHVYKYDQLSFKSYFQPIESSSRAFADVRAITLKSDSILLVGSDLGYSEFKILDSLGNIELMDHISIGLGDQLLKGTIVNDLLLDNKNQAWIGTDVGLFVKSGDKIRSYVNDPANERSITSDHVLKLLETSDHEIWVGTAYGLNKFNPLDETFDRFTYVPSGNRGLPHNTVMDIIEDNSGRLFIGTLGGLCVMDRKTNTFIHFRNEFYNDHSLSNDFVNSLLKDDLGNIWIGTERGGVNFFNTSQNRIEHFAHVAEDPNSLSASTVNSIFEDKNYLWVGTAGGGLNKLDKKTGEYTWYRHDLNRSSSIASNFVTAITRDINGRLLVATWGTGLEIFNEKNGSFEHRQNISDNGLMSGFISSLLEDDSGNIWIGTLGGLALYRPDTESFESFFTEGKNKITQVGCLLFDKEQNLWVGTRFGLYKIQFDSDGVPISDITKYEYDYQNKGSLSGNYVISILEDVHGELWFGTYGQGLNKLHTASDSVWFEHFSVQEGLSNTIIYGIEQDANQQLWLSTDYGLSRLDPKTKSVRNFYETDGLLNNQYYWSASYKNAHGKLYFGGMNGLDAFYPEGIGQEMRDPRVVITDIKLLNESVIPGREYNGVTVLDQNPFKIKQIELSYQEKAFGVEFSALNYQESGMIHYAYILEGFEKDWNYVPASRRYAGYTNLKPGDYTFKVKASASNGQFLTAPRTFQIHIAPPFWETRWFRTLSLVALIALILGYIRFRTYTLNKQKILLERQVKERTERINQQNEALSYQAVQLRNNNHELEDKQKLIEGQNQKLEVQNKEILSQRDELISLNKKLKLVSQLKLSFFTNISHEFRTPLTLILGPLEKLMREYQFDQEVKNTLKVMHRNSQRLLHLINQVMDFRKIEKGRMELHVSQASMSDFCKNLFKAFEPLAEIKQIQFDYQESNLPSKVWFDTAKLENIIYNLLSNAFKYTPNKGKVKLEVAGIQNHQSKLQESEISQLGQTTVISIKVTDSGIGISEENLPLIFKRFYRIESEEAFKVSGSGIGLALTEELIKTHHGQIFVSSQLGEGSTFEVEFPCLKGVYGADERTREAYEGVSITEQIEVLKNELMVKDEHEEEEPAVIDKSRATVLIVEDSLDLRSFMIHRLAKTYNVLEAENGLIGLQLADRHSPDIIISDVMMPKMDGLELCANIKGNLGTSHIPVILLTAKSAIEDQLEGLHIGADDYLPKPFNFELLEVKIQNFIETRRKLRHLFLQSSDFHVNEATTNSKDQNFLEKAIEIVEAQLNDSDFGVKEFVEAMGISRSLLHKKLTNLTEQSAAEFINHLRMKKAKVLLRENSMNISEVAYAVGYNDPKYFSRLFSRHFGQSPKDFIESVLIS